MTVSRPVQECQDRVRSLAAAAAELAAAAQAAGTMSQLASDLEIFASPSFGYLTLDASLCRASVLMPQKRNPYALPVLRGGAGTLIGRLSRPPAISPRRRTWRRRWRCGSGSTTAPHTGWSAGPSPSRWNEAGTS